LPSPEVQNAQLLITSKFLKTKLLVDYVYCLLSQFDTVLTQHRLKLNDKIDMTGKRASIVLPAPTETDGQNKAQTREVWSSRTAFYFATAGAAIGFGNVWRFPGLSVKYGGGSFFIPYLLALFFIGIPLTVLEIGFGQYFQTGDIGVFGTYDTVRNGTVRYFRASGNDRVPGIETKIDGTSFYGIELFRLNCIDP